MKADGNRPYWTAFPGLVSSPRAGIGTPAPPGPGSEAGSGSVANSRAPSRRSRGSIRPWLAAAGLLLAISCTPSPAPAPVPAPAGGTAPLTAELDAAARGWVDATLASLDLRGEVGQLVFQWIPGSYASTSSPEFEQIAGWVREDGIGGVAISIGLPHSYAAKLNALQSIAPVPLLVTSDFENGGPGMRVNHSYALPSLLAQGGGTSFPPTMAFGAIGDPRYAYEYGRITSVEARALGVHLNFAPVLDVNSNPENPVINTRSFGEDPQAVARLGVAFIEGSRAGGVLTTAKHFPGHGDTRTDSHIELPVVDGDRESLDAVELVPFREAVAAGVDAVMTAHVAVPGVLGPDAPPATLSSYFLTDVLRSEMGFRGLLFTDALRMGAITEAYGGGEAAVLALEAGSDVLLVPADVDEAIAAVLAAVEEGRVSRERIRSSVRRILEAKARVGLHRMRRVDLEAVDEIVGSRSHLAFADSAAARSITLPRDRKGLVPLPAGPGRRIVSITYARTADLVAGREFDAVAGGFVGRLEAVRLTDGSSPAAYDSARTRTEGADVVLVNAYVPPRSGAGSVAVPDALVSLVRELDAARPTVVSSFGNPYLLAAFGDVGTYVVAWGEREVSQRAGAWALFGAVPIQGTLPISLPPFHRKGEGLRREALSERVALREGTRALDALGETQILPRRSPPGGRSPAGSPVGGGPEAPSSAGRWASVPEPDEALRKDGAMTISVREVAPASLGLSASGLEAVDRAILAAIADSATPGAVLVVGRHGRLARLRGYGRLDWDAASGPATPSSIYDMASITKVVATTTAAMLLARQGSMELDAPVVRYLPWWSGGHPDKERVTIRQLLVHRAGLPPFRRFFLEMEGRAAFERAIADLPLDHPPGDRTVYSDIGLMTVGFVVEAVSGEPLDRFLWDRVWHPLGMQDTGFRPPPSLLPRIAPTEVDTTYRHVHVHGVVHDENAFALGGVAGHAGLFSSARDLAVFAQMMLDGGSAPACTPTAADGVPCSAPRASPDSLLEAALVDAFTRRQDPGSSRALGWDTPGGRSSAGDYLTERAFGHTGFTGPSLWIDPELDLFVVLLTNRVNPTRENQKHVALRRAVHDGVARAITDRPVTRRMR